MENDPKMLEERIALFQKRGNAIKEEINNIIAADFW
jgi:hypothetical protein